MHYRQLGNSGLRISCLGLGTMTFGSSFYNIGVINQEQANAMVAHAVQAGINFFDTADLYSYGESERILGRTIVQLGIERESVVIATKVRAPMSEAAAQGTGDVNNVGLSRKHIVAACEASLRRLGTNYIDLYQVHGWDRHTPLEETLRALDDLVRAGKVRYIGCSNWSARHLAKAVELARHRGWERFVSLQAYYSAVGRDLEHELLPLCQEEDLGVLPWSPLAGGYLSGKFRRDRPAPTDARRAQFDFPPVERELVYQVVDVMAQIAEEVGASVAQVALVWLLSRPAVSSVIIGAKRLDQLEDNLKADALQLTDAQLARISAVTAPSKLYPQWMIEQQNAIY